MPQSPPVVAHPPRDPDFGVFARHPGLRRQVEMYQWVRVGDGYARAWRSARVDSSGFAPGHANPRAMPLQAREWRAEATVDGRPLARAIVGTLGTWRGFRPGFTALPPNMAATFQPEGDGLGSADNPLAPQVGDLRVTWSALELPPLEDRLVLRDGAWTLRPQAGGADTEDGGDAAAPSPTPARRHPGWGWLAGAAVVALAAALAARFRRRVRARG